MKRTFITLLLALAILGAQAQQYYKSTKDGKAVSTASRWKDYGRSQYWGVRAGVAFAHGWMSHGQMGSVSTDGRTGFNMALLYGKQIATPDVPLFIEGGLRYVQKGYKSHFTHEGENYRYSHNMNFLQIPAHIKYKFRAGADDLTVQPFIGGFLELGVGSQTLVYEHPTMSRNKPDTFGDEIFSRLDAGLRFGVGMAYQNFYVEMAYDWGMVNLCGDKMKEYYPQNTLFDETAHNGCFSICIGIDF